MLKKIFSSITNAAEIEQLKRENALLLQRERLAIDYIRRKTNQLLLTIGTLPLKPEELDEQSLFDFDPIGVISDSFAQVLAHLKEVNTDLKLAHDEIRAIFESVGAGILVLDDQMRILDCNARVRDLFFREKKTMIGERCSSAVCGCDSAPENCTFTRIMASKRSIQQRDWVYGDRHFDVIGTPVKDRFGNITRVVLAYNDITERLATVAILSERERQYRNLFEFANDLIQSVAIDGSFIFVNRAWRKTLGYTEAEVMNLNLFKVIHPDCRDHCKGLFNRLLQEKALDHVDVVFQAKDGTPVPLDGSVSCIYSDGVPYATSGIFRKPRGGSALGTDSLCPLEDTPDNERTDGQ